MAAPISKFPAKAVLNWPTSGAKSDAGGGVTGGVTTAGGGVGDPPPPPPHPVSNAAAPPVSNFNRSRAVKFGIYVFPDKSDV